MLAVLAFATAAKAAASQSDLLVSGQMDMAIIDGDNDGPDSGDCRVRGTFLPMSMTDGTVDLAFMQDGHTPLRLCGAEFTGEASFGSDESSNFGDVVLDNILGSHFGAHLPITTEFVDETSNPNGEPPLKMDDPLDEVTLFDGSPIDDTFENAAPDVGNVLGFGKLCGANGPAALITLDDGVTMLHQLSFFTDQQSQKFLCIPGVPLEKCSNNCMSKAGFDVFNTYVPVKSDGTLTLALSSDPDTNLVDIDLNHLPECPGRMRSPSLSEGKLIGLMLALLISGTWLLSRRPGFRQSIFIP